MKRMHIGVVVTDFDASLKFYNDLFGHEPTFLADGYARWFLDDPLVNFVINTQGPGPGIDHLGIQVESDDVVREYGARWKDRGHKTEYEGQSNCGYAVQTKHWISDPQGLMWEAFHSSRPMEEYGENDLPDTLISDLTEAART